MKDEKNENKKMELSLLLAKISHCELCGGRPGS